MISNYRNRLMSLAIRLSKQVSDGRDPTGVYANYSSKLLGVLRENRQRITLEQIQSLEAELSASAVDLESKEAAAATLQVAQWLHNITDPRK